ncbi:MAG: hypothetical protein JWM80_3748 [Cyanobacteria bacterium RYN_339]|nr:hypothetical protein [Cyanobacteria bacterium RYN_339]
MRCRSIALSLLASVLIAGPAAAVPVYVTARLDNGPVGADLPVVAFSYDVKKLFPAVQSRFDQWRPVPPASVAQANKLIPPVPSWNSFHLVHAVQLQDFREAFVKAHSSDRELVKLLLPRFDNVFRKYGERQPDQSPSDVLASEDSRQIWCGNVTHDLNAIISAYNAGVGGGDAANAQYRELYARWLGKRNEALRLAIGKAGGNANLGYVEANTNEAGLAVFDVPPGRWYFACQLEATAWYKPVIVPAGGGRVLLRPEEATHEIMNLAEWIGS